MTDRRRSARRRARGWSEFVYEGQTDLLLATLLPEQVRLVWSAP